MAFWTELVSRWEKARAISFASLGLSALIFYTWLVYGGVGKGFDAREDMPCSKRPERAAEPFVPAAGGYLHSDVCKRTDLKNGWCGTDGAELILEDRRCSERVDPLPRKLTTVSIKDSCLLKGLSLDHTVVAGDIQIENSELRNGKDAAAALSLRGVEATAVAIERGAVVERLEIEATNIRGVLALHEASFGTLEVAGSKIGAIESNRLGVTGPPRRGNEYSFILRDLQVGQIGFEIARLGSVDLTTVSVQGGVVLSGSRWDKAQLNNLKSTQLALSNAGGVTTSEPRLEVHNVDVVQFDLDAAYLGDVTLSNVQARSELSLEGARWRSLVVDHLRVGQLDLRGATVPFDGEASVHLMQVQADEIDMTGRRLSTLKLQSVSVGGDISLRDATWECAAFNSANMRELSLGAGKGGLVELADSRIARMEVTGFEAREGGYGRWQGGAVAELAHEPKPKHEHDRGSADLVRLLHAQRRDDAIPGFRTLENNLRERGQRAEANWVHVEGLSHRESLDRVRCLYQDGLGSPLAYALLLLSLIWFGACFFSVQKVHAIDGPAPRWQVSPRRGGEYVATQEAAKAATGTSERIAGYSPFIMSLATLLPGDSLNYLRNFKFVPRADRHAWVIVVLQVFALLVEGLIVYSVSSLLAR